MANKYTFEKFKSDMELLDQHPTDVDLINAIAKKVKKSPKDLKAKMVAHIEEEHMMEYQIFKLLETVQSRSPDHLVVFRSIEDPWFHV